MTPCRTTPRGLEFDGKKSHFSDRFSGDSVYVSYDNPNFKTSRSFAELVETNEGAGPPDAQQYTQAIMGRYRHPLLDKDTGVYSYDELVVLRKSRIPAVLLEAGSIINRDEELKMDSPNARTSSATPSRRQLMNSVILDGPSMVRCDGAVTTPPRIPRGPWH